MKKILLIEDESLLSELLEKRLKESGYDVLVAEDGEIGLAKVFSESPDLVLLDILLPKRNGMEILRKMHESNLTDKIPVVIISNSGQPVELEEAQKLGAKDWLVKADFDPDEVIEKVKTHIG